MAGLPPLSRGSVLGQRALTLGGVGHRIRYGAVRAAYLR